MGTPLPPPWDADRLSQARSGGYNGPAAAVTQLFLFAVAFLGGALNSVAGGGSFLALPALISVGIPAVSANATTTLALWPGSLSSAVAYRDEIQRARGWLISLGAVSVVGGLLGGWLLVNTTDARFLRLLPWLMLAAAVTFTFGNAAVKRLRPVRPSSATFVDQGSAAGPEPRAPGPRQRAARTEHPASSPEPRAPSTVPVWILLFQLLVATYGGYFGGGIGIMMLAGLAVAGMSDIHEMNGIKSLLAVAINGVALIEFVVSGTIAWAPGLVMVAGGICGGYIGASVARRLPPKAVRTFVVALAWLMTGYFFYRA